VLAVVDERKGPTSSPARQKSWLFPSRRSLSCRRQWFCVSASGALSVDDEQAAWALMGNLVGNTSKHEPFQSAHAEVPDHH
jgi:hypothetical protein